MSRETSALSGCRVSGATRCTRVSTAMTPKRSFGASTSSAIAAPWLASAIFVCPATCAFIEPELSSTIIRATLGVSAVSSWSVLTGRIASIGVRK